MYACKHTFIEKQKLIFSMGKGKGTTQWITKCVLKCTGICVAQERITANSLV